MTAQSLWDWVNDELLVSSHLPPFFPLEIFLRTAVRWLHHLGFKPVSHKKGIYIDGHEQEDVVKDLLKILHDLRSSHCLLPLVVTNLLECALRTMTKRTCFDNS